ncbi:hypothetical protein JAAARDRAFT_36016 [Jaapia argillacea MUCL 33604]|uniref:Uncharacterized protein n=1 Tax=Jaapia argillacea MUCL 33604 TaxID=933084 RepID=A0A067PNZ6_9AGAM|nr:hypothetical protein JAAARDRAFT_36016 [Jaapia argillacea MUCL 33604]
MWKRPEGESRGDITSLNPRSLADNLADASLHRLSIATFPNLWENLEQDFDSMSTMTERPADHSPSIETTALPAHTGPLAVPVDDVMFKALVTSTSTSVEDSSPGSSARSTRPQTISELVQRALEEPFDSFKELNDYLRAAEKARDAGRDAIIACDLENAFVQFAKAATIVLEWLPAHRDYTTLLTPSQKHNLGLVRTPYPFTVGWSVGAGEIRLVAWDGEAGWR